MPRPVKARRWAGAAALALAAALPVLAQDTPTSILPPGFGEAPRPAPGNSVAPAAPAAPGPAAPDRSPVDADVVASDTLSPAEAALAAPVFVPQPEYPAAARRDPQEAGVLDAAAIGVGPAPWGSASGKFLQILMRRMDTPLASRWAHIGLRNVLLVKGPAPADVDPADWAAERAWLLLRMGEADAARLLVASIDSDRYTPKMVQVAAQVALATGDPAALCPLKDRLARIERDTAPLVQAMCAALAGESERAAADVEAARRRGTLGGIDHALADKVVGATADSARAVTIEWQPVKSLNSWRFGLATATGLMPPKGLIDNSSPQMKAWLARSPMFPAADKLPYARVAAALGVLSSDAYVDLFAGAFDAADPDELGATPMWRLRQAYVGRDQDARLGAMRGLWADGDDRLPGHLLTARAATLVRPSAKLSSDAPDLIAAMLSAGFDRQAARWAAVLDDLDDADADRCWAMLALGAPDTRGLDLGEGRIRDFADNDDSRNRARTALLVAGLAGLGRIDGDTVNALNARYKLGLGRTTEWSALVDGAAARRQPGTAAILAATGMQGDAGDLPAFYLYHGIAALNRVGLAYHARMIAAEAMARS